MAEKLVAELSRVIDELVKQGKLETRTVAKLAENISKGFQVKPDEVAIITLVQQEKFLQFVVPEKLQKIGTIPVTSTTALAARTARDKRPEVINNFTTAKHTTVFEAVPLSPQRGDPIQKIMSAPIAEKDKVMGVIQVSRKGKSVSTAGPDFTPKDLSALCDVAAQLARCLPLVEL